MATKKAHTDFNRQVAKYLQSIGAEFVLDNGISGRGKLKTVAGDLHISLREPERSEVFSIFCRFEDVEKAKRFFIGSWHNKLNEYSGKWNFHTYDASELLEEFKSEITRLLLPVLTL